MRTGLILIVVVLAASDITGIDFSLAPGLSAKNALLYFAFGLLLVQKAITRQPKLRLVWLQALFLCMIAYAVGSVVFNIVVVELPRYELLPQIISMKTQMVDRLVIFLLFFYVARTEADVNVVLSWLLAMIALGCLFTITNVVGLTSIGPTIYGNDDDVEQGRIYGYFGHANETGTLIAALIPAWIAMAQNARGRVRLAWIVALAAAIIMLVMTGSRGAMVGLLLGGGAVAYTYRRHFDRREVRRWFVLSMTVLLPLLLVLAWQSIETLAQRVAMQTSGHLGDASSGRTELWADALGAMMDSPWTFLTGFGWGGWENHNFRYVAHNSYLSYWFDLGLLGLLGLLFLVVGTMVVARRAMASARTGEKSLMIAYMVGMASLLVALAFLNLYTPWPYLWAYIGLMMRMAVLVNARAHAAAKARVQPITGAAAGRSVVPPPALRRA